MTPLKIALTKGRLEEKTVALFEKMGYDCSQIYNKGRRLILPVGDGEIEVVLAKAADVITYVQHGVCDLGVVGKDTIMESTGGFFEVLDLGFGKCRFAVAGPKDSGIFEGYSAKTVATKYPKVARAFFENRDMDVRIIKIEGSVELAPLLGLAEAIVDLVETGSTLKENGLEILETICPISARLIVNSAVMKLRKEEIESLVSRIGQASRKKEERLCLSQYN
ncbi:MAG: ATP phosphoribosyltransferase [Clostridium sp.]|uniref:ATP phosphoribosyltransferase n=1 Tax=Clostridium sp. TaxID=1506 RepID=UPI002914A334|nr:ATP phosphoribosyltransferase [Clostridium sp.]MDU7337434.1 ATP phosphoribosyltransferase [Clostridium sp.]